MAAAAAAGESDSSSSKPNSPKWAMLDRYVFKSFDLDACGDGTTSPECRTGQGVPFRISLRLSTPPAVSRLYLHMPTGAAETHCRILASHRDALLLSMYEPFTEPVDGQGMPRFYDQELFVYIAGSTPSLTLLPACTRSPQEVRDDDHAESFASDDAESFASDGANSVASDGPSSFASDGPYSFASDGASSLASDGADSVKLDHGDGQLENIAPAKDGYDPLALITQFELHAVGIQCNDTGDYAVAYLCVSRCLTPGSGAEVVEAQLCVYHSSKSTWELHARPIPYHDDKELSELTRWSTNRITTFGTYLCWIDYNCGILFCDLFAKRLNVTYISLPVEACRCPEACMDMYRNVCVVQDRDGSNKKMKFVDVSPHHGYYFRPPPSSRFELNIWTLVTDEGDGSMSWTHEFMIQDHELRISDLVPSPHGPLTFPVMSIEEPDVAYFAVGPYGYFVKNMWIVPVDLNGRSAKCAFPYLKGEEDLLGDDADMARTKAHCFEPFLPCDINLFFPQATGDMTALRNAPVLLPSCVEGEGFKTSARKEGPILPWAYSNAQEVNVRRLHSKASIECAQNTATQIVCPQCATRFVQAKCLQQVSFRLLCPVNLVGGLIGTGGLIIKGIEKETSVCIDVGYPCSGCTERVVTIAAMESPDQCSKVQGALVRIFNRMAEVEMSSCSEFDKPSQFLARVLVTKSQVGCLVGVGGATMKDMVNLTRARIRILDETDVPACASHCEKIIQITGDLFNVTYALCLVSWNLRTQVFHSERTSYNNGYILSSDLAQMSTIRQANISKDVRFSTGIFPWVDDGASLSYEMDSAENTFRSINFGPPEAQVNT